MNRIRIGIVALLAASAGVVSQTGVASADSSCDTTEVCLYQASNYLEGIYTQASNVNSYSGLTFSITNASLGDRTSSVKNRSSASYRVEVYQNANWGGNILCLNSGQNASSLPWGAYSLGNDSASSHKFPLGTC